MIGVELFKVCVTRGGEEFWKCLCGAEWPGWQVGVCPNCGPTLTDAPTEALPACPCGKVPTVLGQAMCATCSLESDIRKALHETRNRAAIQTMACISYPRAREIGMSPPCLPVQLCGINVCADVTIASEDRGVYLASAPVAKQEANCFVPGCAEHRTPAYESVSPELAAISYLESKAGLKNTDAFEAIKHERDEALARANRLGDECGRLQAENARLKAGKR